VIATNQLMRMCSHLEIDIYLHIIPRNFRVLKIYLIKVENYIHLFRNRPLVLRLIHLGDLAYAPAKRWFYS
jgi:hypothetical protein